MNGRWSVVVSLGVLCLAAATHAGGWGVATVRELPAYVVAGKPLQLTFRVLQHGVTPLDGLKPTIVATAGANVVNATATPTKNTGEYTTTLVMRQAGQWTIAIDSDYIKRTVLPALTVIAPGTPAPPPLSRIALGQRLFVVKGCNGCHINHEADAENLFEIGPDLTGKRFPDAYLTSFLADPQAVLARKAEAERGEMPNLGLKGAEIAALVAFINRERSGASGSAK